MPGKTGNKPARRHRKVLRDNIKGVTKPAIRRLARRGGVSRISGQVYDEIRTGIPPFLGDVLNRTEIYMESARRKTVTADDVVHGLEKFNIHLYGWKKQKQ